MLYRELNYIRDTVVCAYFLRFVFVVGMSLNLPSASNRLLFCCGRKKRVFKACSGYKLSNYFDSQFGVRILEACYKAMKCDQQLLLIYLRSRRIGRHI